MEFSSSARARSPGLRRGGRSRGLLRRVGGDGRAPIGEAGPPGEQVVGEGPVIDEGGISGHRLLHVLKPGRIRPRAGALGVVAAVMTRGAQGSHVDAAVPHLPLDPADIVVELGGVFAQRLRVLPVLLGELRARPPLFWRAPSRNRPPAKGTYRCCPCAGRSPAGRRGRISRPPLSRQMRADIWESCVGVPTYWPFSRSAEMFAR